MYLNDPTLYSVTPREMSTPFVGGFPFAWQNIPRLQPPFQSYGMQPFHPYGMQHFGQFGFTPFQAYGTPYFVPPFAYSYGTPSQTAPWMATPGGACNLPFTPPIQGWQRPFWY